MGTSKQQRKYKNKQEQPRESVIKFKVLINNHYYLNGDYESWEEADIAGKMYTKGRRAIYVVVTGV